MIRFIILGILVNLSVFSYSQVDSGINRVDEEGQKQGQWIKYQDNGKKLFEGTFLNDKPVGIIKRYHKNGRLKAILNYSSRSDSVDVQLFDINSKLLATGKYIDKLKIGNWKYYKSESLISEENFNRGNKNGICKTYYPDGRLFEKAEWVNGKQHGLYTAYFKNGNPFMECKMSNDMRDGYCMVYHADGRLELEAFYEKNLRHNEWKYFKKNGDISYTLEYQMGILMNPEVADSVQQIELKQMDSNRKKIVDPEEFLQDPSEYILNHLH